MTKEQIDRLIGAVQCGDRKELAKFISDIKLRKDYLTSWRKDYDTEHKIEIAVYRDIMAQIENDGYEYFYSKTLEDESARELLTGLHDPEKIMRCFEDSDELEFDNCDKIEMIKSSRDVGLIRACLEGKIDGVRPDDEQKLRLITASRDIAFMKECIAGDVKVRLSKKDKQVLIASSGDIEFIKEYIEGKLKGVRPNDGDKRHVLEMSGNVDLIASCIEGKLKGYNPNDMHKFYLMLPVVQELDDEVKLTVLKGRVHENDQLGEILATFSSLSEECKKYFEEYLAYRRLPTDNLELPFKILTNLGPEAFGGDRAKKRLAPEAINALGEETIYSLFNYNAASWAVDRKAIEIDKIIENPEMFHAYEQFRRTFAQEQPTQFMDKRNAITEFSKYASLIGECLSGPLTSEETAILQAVLQDGQVQINSKEELPAFPEKRKEMVEELIGDDPYNALCYLLTGKNSTEYYFVNAGQLTRAMQDFGKESADFAITKALNEFIELIGGGMSVTQQKKVLRAYNNDLQNEFTAEGSQVAEFRKAFRDIELQIRRMYGKELADTLIKDELPHGEADEKGNETIQLAGEDFKMLVCGIDTYKQGTGNFAQMARGKKYISTTLISEKHLSKAGATRYYGFRNIGENALVTESNYAKYPHPLTELERESEFFSADKLSENNQVNQVMLRREYLGDDGKMRDITPDYIVCFDGMIDDGDREEAKRLGVPIVVINTQEYEKRVKENSEEKAEPAVEVPAEYENTKKDMMDILRNARKKCTVKSQRVAMGKIIAEMEKELQADKNMMH
ncbi:MAG: hypothetical protein J6M02_06175 [Clostridia bacterium]|nr:hypothetical protein [Clostridia bacterium]